MTETPWMTPEEAMEYLGGISHSTLVRYRRDEGLPVHYLQPEAKKGPRYHKGDLDAWLRQRQEKKP